MKGFRSVTVLLPIALCLSFYLMTPDMAMAYNFETGAQKTLNLVKLIVIIAVLGGSAVAFFKRELPAAVVMLLVGSLLVFTSDLENMKNVGRAIMGLVGGETGGGSGPGGGI